MPTIPMALVITPNVKSMITVKEVKPINTVSGNNIFFTIRKMINVTVKDVINIPVLKTSFSGCSEKDVMASTIRFNLLEKL